MTLTPATLFGKAFVTPERFILAFIMLGGLFVWLYLDMVIVRNSILYAGIAQAISEHGLFSAHEYARNKPLGFSVVSWPLTALFSATTGLKVSSFLWTALWSITTLLVLRRLAARLEASDIQLKLAVFIALFNPLIVYQFISAYPDTLFASVFILSVLFIDQSLSRQGRIVDSVMAAGLILLCIWVKHHGFVLLPIMVALAWLHRVDIVWLWNNKKPHLLVFLLTMSLVLVVLALAQAGMLSLFNLGHNVDNFTQGDSRLDIFQNNLNNFAIWLVISFGVLIPFLMSWQSFLKQHFLLLIVTIFILPVLFYAGSRYNIRYFIAITPLLAWVIAGQLSILSSKTRMIWLVLFVLSNTFTILYYNHVGFNHIIRSVIALPKLDNLRLVNEQQKAQENLQKIRQYAADYDNNLIYVSRYYGKGTFHIWEKDGVFPKNLNIYYIKRWKNNTMKELGLDKAMVYEYLRPQRARTTRKLAGAKSRFKLNKLSRSLYLVESRHKR